MSVIHEERSPTFTLRSLIFPAVVLLFLGVFVFRLWVLQVVQADELERKAEQLRSASVAISAPRGLILDRKGRVLAGVRSEYVVTGVPKLVREDSTVLPRLATILGVDVQRLERNLAEGNWRPGLPTPVFEGATSQQAIRIIEDQTLAGIGVTTQPIRYYVDPYHFTHVLGYVRAPDEKDVRRFRAEGLDVPNFVGKTGIEFTHDLALSGQAGVEQLVIDTRNRPLRQNEFVQPRPGDRLVLGLDQDLQRYAFELLGERTGSIVAVDPQTGLVLLYACNPSYDANMWLRGLSRQDYQGLLNDPREPLINRAIATGYAPGSTFKIVTALAAELSGTFDPNERVNCPGYYQLGRRRIRCLGQHGSISFQRAFEKSCNTYFIVKGMQVKADALRDASQLLGLGEKTGVDLVGERRGNIPDDAWMRKHYDRPWFPGDTANFSIGQGSVATTPMQLAVLTGAIANQEAVLRPHFVRQIIDSSGRAQGVQPEVIQRLDRVSNTFWKSLRNAMLATVEMGTARGGRVPGVLYGGKTGSAQNHRSRKLADSLFVAYAPIDNPRIAIAVVVENAGHGGEVAAPIAGKLIDRFLNGPPKPPSEGEGGEATGQPRPNASNQAPASTSARASNSLVGRVASR